MSTRDWSDYFADESSVHGREALYIGSTTADPVIAADNAWRAAITAKEEAIASHMVVVPPLSSKTQDWIMDNEVAYEGRLTMPTWMSEKVEAHRDAVKAAKTAAIEAFMDSDEAEAIIAATVDAKTALDKALADRDAAEAAADSVFDAAKGTTGWIVVASRSDAAAVATKTGAVVWSGNPKSVRDHLVLTVSQAMTITSPNNPDRFIPDSVTFHNPDAIRDIGFGRDMDRISSRVNG